jgi:hypothetical protein
MPDKQAEAIVEAISRVDSEVVTRADLKQEFAAVRADLDVLWSDMKAEISTAINKMMLAQIAIAGLLFAALKLF